MIRCMGCMEEIEEGQAKCPYCGYEQNAGVKEAYYLLPGKILGQKYVVGKVLGYGGFGVTYIGWDAELERKVAIKEYLPSDFATRSYGAERLTVYSGEATIQFQAGLESFISEAKRLARFNRIPEIVDIYDCFMENDTGYIIMEFLEGETVKEILKREKKLDCDRARKIILSVLSGLTEIHREGIIHRDIAPDNIFITKTGEVRILDFGAARYATAVQSRSLSVILKPGYAPEEQYRSKGKQGPWTDVYAVGACFYRMITGIRPDEAIERMANDTLQLPSELGIDIPQNVENALMNSLNVRMEYRTQDAGSYYEALKSEDEVFRVVEEIKKEVSGKLPVWIKITAGVAVMLLAVFGILLIRGDIDFSSQEISSTQGAVALQEGEFYLPDISGMTYEEAEDKLTAMKLKVLINGMNYSETIAMNKILSQTPKDGDVISENETVYVVMSGGIQEIMMPELTGMTKEEAIALINAQSLIVDEENIVEEYSDYVEKGKLISQSVEPDKRIASQSKVSFTVSLGSLSTETAVLTVPDLTGMTKKEALSYLTQLKETEGFTYALGKITREYSTEVDKGKIISQGLTPGSQVRTNEPITLVISKGPEMVVVPNVVYVEREEAVQLLKDAGFGVSVTQEYSSQVAKGCIIRQSVDADTEAVKGSNVALVVSLGEEPVRQQPMNHTSSNSSSSNNSSTGTTPESNPPSQENGGLSDNITVIEEEDDITVFEEEDDITVFEEEDNITVYEEDDDTPQSSRR